MYKWKPIADLTQDEKRGIPELNTLLSIWKGQALKLKESESVNQFQEKMNREWAVETGIIENLYSLDRGTTRTLIEHGIEASFIAHDGCDKPPEWVAAVLRDQQNALDFVFDFVGDNRPLSTSYIKEIDEILGNVPELVCRIQIGEAEQSHWFRHQIFEVAEHLEYFADLQTLGDWCRLQIKNGEQTDIVISIHSVGTEFVGVAGVSAYLQVKSPAEDNATSMQAPVPLCKDLFQLTYLDTWEDLIPQYDEWLDDVLAVALDQWQRGL